MEKNMTSGLSDDINKSRYNVPFDMSVDDAIKTITGEAICHVPGVLGLKGGLSDVFKRDEDLRRGISVSRNKTGYEVSAHVIGDAAYDTEEILVAVRISITHALQEGAGMENIELSLSMVDSMSKSDFIEKHGADRTCECIATEV